MSGHSKWNNIKNRKAAEDSKKSKIFTQLAKNITIAVRQSGVGDPTQSPTLRLAVEKARQANMPGDNIQRAISKGQGKGEDGSFEEILYEGYGPGGVGFLVVARTDNKLRSAAEIRHLFEKVGGSLGSPGSTKFLFSFAEGVYSVVVPLTLEDAEVVGQNRELIDHFEAHEDVEVVYHNMTAGGVAA